MVREIYIFRSRETNRALCAQNGINKIEQNWLPGPFRVTRSPKRVFQWPPPPKRTDVLRQWTMNIYLSTWLCRRPTNLWLTWSSSTCCWRTVSDIPWRRSSRPSPRKPWRQDASDTASVGARWGQGCYHIWRQSQPVSRLELATDLDTWKYGRGLAV